MTKNFTIKEFVATGYPEQDTLKERFMLDCLVANLQFIRDELNTPIFITNTYRNRSKYLDMLHKGYFPSETSDHFFGQRMPVTNPDKVKKYGKWFDLSCGAVDFKCADMSTSFKKIVQMSKTGYIKTGQLILEYGNGSQWIHMSNSPDIIYSAGMAAIIPHRNQYQYSLDGGQNYIEFKEVA